MSCTPTLAQDSFIIRNDNGTEITATAKYAERVSGTLALDTNWRVRFHVQVTNACAAANRIFQIEYSKNGGGWTAINGTDSLNVRSTASPNVADAANTTDQMTTGTGTFIGTTAFDEANGQAGGTQLDIAASGQTEVEFCIQLRSADLTNGDLIELRVTDSQANLNSWPSIPAIPIAISVSRTPTVGSLSLGNIAPGIFNPVYITPAAGIARFGLTSYGIAASSGTTTFTGTQAVIGTGAASVEITPTTGALNFASDAPTVTATDHVTRTPTIGALVLTPPIAPSLLTNDIRGPPIVGLTFAGNQPTLQATDNRF
ncbi:MAG TPA: hypothetical protein VFK30_09425, partial [Anaerolineae bacterium]|nr:hypothetical protein [Anaerolineae bacterium]